MHSVVARIADIVVSVWRADNRHCELAARAPFNDIETAPDRFTTNRTQVTRFLVLHGSCN